MTAEKYVNAIVKKIKCSTGKRQEIKKRLLSDISAAVESGETMDEVIQSMGTVKDVAAEFNDNLSEEEKKKYKKAKGLKIAGCIVAILILLIAVIYWFLPKTSEIGTSGIFNDNEVEAQMKLVVETFNQEDYEALKEISIAQMQPLLNKEYMDEAKKQIGDDWGEFKSFGMFQKMEIKQQGQNFVIGQVKVTYENVIVLYTITFDEEMKLAGFYMG